MEEIKVGDLTIKPSLSMEIKEIHPAIGVVDETAYVGVWIPCEVVDKDGNVAFKDLLYLVTDKRDTILANDEILRGKGWRLAYKPIKFWNRWPLNDAQNYLNGASVNPCEVFNQLTQAWKEYMEFSDEREYFYHAIWDIGTYFHHLFNAFPYLFIGGVKRCGKTKNLTLHSCLAFNAFFSNNMSTSSIYRLIQNARGTLIIDETEKLSKSADRASERTLEFRSILLAGYKKGEKVYRVEKTRREMLQPEAFEVYSPKALANIQGLEDVLEDRCKNVFLRKSRNIQIINREVDINDPTWSKIRSNLYIFYLAYWNETKAIYDELNVGSEGSEGFRKFEALLPHGKDQELLAGRELELWKPIIALALFLDRKGCLPLQEPSQPTQPSLESMSSPSTSSSPDPSQLTLPSLLISLALENAKQRHIENITEVGENILVQVLQQTITKDGYYRVKDIKDEMAGRFDEEQRWLNSEWVGRALRRLGFKEKRRVGTGTQYFFSVKEVQDLAERMEIDTPPFNLDNVLTVAAILETRQGKCGYCGTEGPMNREAVLHNKDRIALCDDCAWKIEKRIQEEE